MVYFISVVNKGVTILYRKVEKSSPCGFFVSAIIYYNFVERRVVSNGKR